MEGNGSAPLNSKDISSPSGLLRYFIEHLYPLIRTNIKHPIKRLAENIFDQILRHWLIDFFRHYYEVNDSIWEKLKFVLSV